MTNGYATPAHEFFARHVEPAVAEWRANRLDDRRAMQAAVALNQLADYYFHSVPVGDARRHGAQNVGELRAALGTQAGAFALIRDIADAHKHLTLHRPGCAVTGAGQTGAGRMGWGEAEYGVGEMG
jgi:hypothetical protein